MAEYFVYNGGLYSTDELKHYGVKGMKWGVRKAINRSGKDSRRMIKKTQSSKRQNGKKSHLTKLFKYEN